MCKNELALALASAMSTCVVLGASASARAQERQEQAAEQTREADELDTITVTVQRREQWVQDVPVALQIVSDQMIDNLVAEDLGDIDDHVPGLSIDDRQPTQPTISLRGVTTRDFGIGTDSAVGVYVDGVYAGRGAGTVLPFLDIERVEVIKGPQGTLFGRNTAGGAISVITKAPEGENAGRASAQFGSDGKRRYGIMADLALGETAALRFNVLSDRSDGWLRNATDGSLLNPEEEWAGRLSFRTSLGESTTLRVSWDHEELDQRSRPITGIVTLPAAPGVPPLPIDTATYVDPFRSLTRSDVVGGDETRDYDGVRVIAEHDFSKLKLTSTTGWSRYSSFNRAEEDGTDRRNLYVDTTNEEENRSIYQEFRLESTTEKFDWIAGASFYRENGRQSSGVGLYTDSVDTLLRAIGGAPTPDGTLYSFFDQVLQANGIPLTLLGHRWDEHFSNRLDSKSYALFGDAIWHASDRLKLTFGLRYSRDRKDFTWLNAPRDAPTLDATLEQLDAIGFFTLIGVPRSAFVFDAVFVDPPAQIAKGETVRKSSSWSDLSPRIVLDYHFTPRTMGYVSLAKGYKAGGFNAVQVGSEFDNEVVWNAEVGLKGISSSNGLSYSASLFHYRYDDRQAIRLDLSQSVPRYVVDTADLAAFGLDFDLRWQASRNFTLDAGAAYIDSEYRRYVNPDGQDLSGQPTGVPSFTFSAGAEYRRNVGFGDIAFSLRGSHRGAVRCNGESVVQGSCSNSPALQLGEARKVVDVKFGWSSPRRVWHVNFYGKNIFDDRYVEGLASLGSPLGVVGATVSEPRRYGFEVQVSF